MTEEFWLWLGAVALGAGAVAVAFIGGSDNARSAAKTAIHTLVPLIAAIAYVTLATGAGMFDLDGDGSTFHYVRYVDWVITTPLLLVALTITAAPLGRNLWALATVLVLADVAMIATGLVAAAGRTVETGVWFLLSMASYLVVLALLWGPIRAAAASGHPVREETFTRHALVLTVLWSLYPLVFLLGPPGMDVFGIVTLTALYTILDVAAKTGYGVLVVLEDRRLAEAENADRDAAEPFEPVLVPVLVNEAAAPARPAPAPTAPEPAAPAPVAAGIPRAPDPAPYRSAPPPAGRSPRQRRLADTAGLMPAAVATTILMWVSRPRGRR
jgi:bacteriorhodopsin